MRFTFTSVSLYHSADVHPKPLLSPLGVDRVLPGHELRSCLFTVIHAAGRRFLRLYLPDDGMLLL